MRYTKLGATGLNVSRICLGTMTFGLQTDEDSSRRILDTAAAAGVTFLDTADVYPLGGDLSTVGRTEEIVGRALQGQRHKWVIASKAFGKVGPAAWDQGNSRKHLLDAIEGTLRRLQTDYVDLYQLHGDDANTPLDETLEALDSIVRSGKARYIGVSNFLAYRLALALGRSDVQRIARVVSVQPRYALLFREVERELLPLAREQGIAVIPYNPLAGGFLSGKHRFETGPTSGTRFTLGNAAERYQERYWHKAAFATVEALRPVVQAADLPLTTASVAWVLAHPAVTSAIIGASRAEQLTETLRAADIDLPVELKHKLDELTTDYRRGDSLR
jgi:aryl-alcohol dehydrogenase-like predicted oxidoreductase